MVFEPKNIVICLDGTGNQVEQNVTNVLKLYRCIEKRPRTGPEQIVYYDQGVGTVGLRRAWHGLGDKVSEVAGLATGLGLDKNVLEAYDFICRNYRESHQRDANGERLRDRIYLFGYSRGAHTARVLAAFIYHIGLLRPELLHLAGAALTAYKKTAKPVPDDPIDSFRRNLQPRTAPIHFLGVWDTVSSMIVPGGKVAKAEKLPSTADNPAVRAIRHAMSIDEARYMFRLDRWKPGNFSYRRMATPTTLEAQDCKEVWFPGFHGDVGGGNKRPDSGLSQFSLCWMIKEASAHDLKFRTQNVNYIARGDGPANAIHVFPKPCHRAPTHGSSRTPWLGLEWLPKLSRFREPGLPKELKRGAAFGLYIPRFEPRHVQTADLIHASAYDKLKDDESYTPKNLPAQTQLTNAPVPHPAGRAEDWW